MPMQAQGWGQPLCLKEVTPQMSFVMQGKLKPIVSYQRMLGRIHLLVAAPFMDYVMHGIGNLIKAL